MTTHRHELAACPVCAHPLDAATPVDATELEPPREGDLTICIECTAFLTFTGTGLRELTDEEIGELHDDNRIELQRARRALKSIHARKAPP